MGMGWDFCTPTKPIPQHTGLIWVQTPLETPSHAVPAATCHLHSTRKRAWTLVFECFDLSLSTSITTTCQLATPTSTTAENKRIEQGEGKWVVLPPISKTVCISTTPSSKTSAYARFRWWFVVSHSTTVENEHTRSFLMVVCCFPKFHFTTLENECLCSFSIVVDCFLLPTSQPLPSKTSTLLVFNGGLIFCELITLF